MYGAKEDVRTEKNKHSHIETNAAFFDKQMKTLVTIGGEAFALKMISIFNRDVPIMMRELKHAVETFDFKAIANCSHKLGGSLMIFELNLATKLSRKLQDAAEQQNETDVVTLFQEFEETIEPILDYILNDSAD